MRFFSGDLLSPLLSVLYLLQASSVSLDTFFFLPLQFFLNTSWELVIWFVSNLKVKLALCKRTISACELYKVQNNDPVSLLRLLNQLEMLYIFCSLEYFIHLQKKKKIFGVHLAVVSLITL